MKFLLYTIDCPKCLVLEKKLDLKGCEYEKNMDRDFMLAEGMTILPILELEDGKRLNFKDAVDYLKTIQEISLYEN